MAPLVTDMDAVIEHQPFDQCLAGPEASRSRSAQNRGHAFVKRRSRFGEITRHDGVKYAAGI